MAIPARLRRLITRPAPVPVEVHTEARRCMALLVRRLIARRIDNFEFDDAAETILGKNWHDPALDHAYLWCWGLYDDMKRHRVGPRPAGARRTAARIVAFLRTDLPYCWVDDSEPRVRVPWRSTLADAFAWIVFGLKIPVVGLLAGVVRLMLFYTPGLVAPRAPARDEREEAWPFADREELALACAAPTYLVG